MRLLGDVATAANHAIAAGPVSNGTDRRSFLFDAGVLSRGANALKSVRILCELAHWENAAGIVRQLFELTINMEYINSCSDRTEQCVRYTKFGLMQTLEHERLTLTYNKETGRQIDEDRLRKLQTLLTSEFGEFRKVTSTGKVVPDMNWCGLNPRKLSEQSKNKLRPNQYLIMFSNWSEQAHAAPGAVIEGILPREFDPDKMVRDDTIRIAETSSMALSLFLELWTLLPNVQAPGNDELLSWTNEMVRLARQYGSIDPS